MAKSIFWEIPVCLKSFMYNIRVLIYIYLTSVTRAKPKEKMEFPA